jgi:hypothetical protein
MPVIESSMSRGLAAQLFVVMPNHYPQLPNLIPRHSSSR